VKMQKLFYFPGSVVLIASLTAAMCANPTAPASNINQKLHDLTLCASHCLFIESMMLEKYFYVVRKIRFSGADMPFGEGISFNFSSGEIPDDPETKEDETRLIYARYSFYLDADQDAVEELFVQGDIRHHPDYDFTDGWYKKETFQSTWEVTEDLETVGTGGVTNYIWPFSSDDVGIQISVPSIQLYPSGNCYTEIIGFTARYYLAFATTEFYRPNIYVYFKTAEKPIGDANPNDILSGDLWVEEGETVASLSASYQELSANFELDLETGELTEVP